MPYLGTYVRGSQVISYANFIDQNGESTSVTDPRILIQHIDSDGNPVVDLAAGVMTQVGTTNTYYYAYTIAEDAELTNYYVEFSATYPSGVTPEASSTFIVSSSAVIPALAGVYTTKEKVAGILPGVIAADIEDEWLEFASAYIDGLVQTQFAESEWKVEKIDIERTDVDTLFLKEYPILEVDYLKNNGTTIDPGDYVIYNDEGIIRLKLEDYLWNIVKSWYFTKGYQEVEVKYKYGTSTVPPLVTYFATLLVANIAVNKYPDKAGAMLLKKEQIGDYSYTKHSGGKEGVINSLKDEIKRVEKEVIYKYSNHPETRAI